MSVFYLFENNCDQRWHSDQDLLVPAQKLVLDCGGFYYSLKQLRDIRISLRQAVSEERLNRRAHLTSSEKPATQ